MAPVAWSLAEAYVNPEIAWPRLVFDGDELVGFVMGGFDPHGPVDAFRCGVWRLNIAAGRQGNGYGRFAVELRLGFRPTGEVIHDQIVGEILLD